MSIRLMNDVWSRDVSGTRLAVLLVFADHANDDGVCWPSTKLAAWKIGVHFQTVRREVRTLMEDGVFERIGEASQHQPPVYKLHLDQLALKAPYDPETQGAHSEHPGDGGQGAQPTNPGCANPVQGAHSYAHQTTIENHHPLEPSKEEPPNRVSITSLTLDKRFRKSREKDFVSWAGSIGVAGPRDVVVKAGWQFRPWRDGLDDPAGQFRAFCSSGNWPSLNVVHQLGAEAAS